MHITLTHLLLRRECLDRVPPQMSKNSQRARTLRTMSQISVNSQDITVTERSNRETRSILTILEILSSKLILFHISLMLLIINQKCHMTTHLMTTYLMTMLHMSTYLSLKLLINQRNLHLSHPHTNLSPPSSHQRRKSRMPLREMTVIFSMLP